MRVPQDVGLVIVIRSALFNVLFYLNLLVLMLAASVTFFMPYWGVLAMGRVWGRTSLWLLRVICGIRYEVRGHEKLPAGGVLVASKHQSMWDAFALLPLLNDYTFIIKRELRWIPFFGWFTIKGRLIPVDRGAGTGATKMLAQARDELRQGRQLVIFPEGTRRAPGAEPAYKFGIARLYGALRVPCVPIALNSGLFWPRRKFLRYPGTVVVEFLDPIPAGLEPKAFFRRLQADIESATARLVEEGRRESGQQAAPASTATA
jgi:1-acyl-sn-glycerol-3-phosphate acyltransferase